MLPNVRTLIVAVLTTLVLAAGVLALLSARGPSDAAWRTAGPGERGSSLSLSAGAEPAELRSLAAARRRQELGRLLSIQIGPVGAHARDVAAVPDGPHTPVVPVADPMVERIVVAALPTPSQKDAAAVPVEVVMPASPTPLAEAPPPAELPAATPGLELASLPVPAVMAEPTDEQTEAPVISLGLPGVDPEPVEMAPSAAGELSPVLPGTVRLPPVRVIAARQPASAAAAARARRAKAAKLRAPQWRTAARQPVQRPAQPTNPYGPQYEGWPMEAFLPPEPAPRSAPGRSQP